MKFKASAKLLGLFVFGVAFAMPVSAYAACTNPASPVGGVAYGSAGDISTMLACDGTDWVPWAGWTITGYPAPQYSSSGGGGGSLDDLSDARTGNSGLYIGSGIGVSTGAQNTVIGEGAFINANDSSINNAVVGWQAMGNAALGVGTSNYNTAVGIRAGYNILNGTYNILIGERAGESLGNGDYNIIIGSQQNAPGGADAQNALNIGGVIFGSGLYTATGHIGINKSTPSVALDVVGDINFTGQIVDVSDIRMKYDIAPLDSPLRKLTTLNGFSFKMKGDDRHATEYGVSAQDVQKVFPELVSVVDPASGTLGVNYNGLIAPMIEAMKEQQAQIDRQNAEIEALRDEVRQLHSLSRQSGQAP